MIDTKSRTLAIGWPQSAYAMGLLLLVLYAPVLIDTANLWLTKDDYSHGFLVIPCSIFIVWINKDRIKAAKPAPSAWGYLFLGGAVAVEVTGYIGQLPHIGMWSLLAALTGAILLLHGPNLWKIVKFPVLFLSFAAPISDTFLNNLTSWLVDFSTASALFVMSNLGFVIVRHGNVLNIPGVTLEIENACSGYHGLITMLAFSTLYGYFFSTRMIQRLLLVASSVPVALIANVTRICVLVAAGSYDGLKGYHMLHDPAQIFEILLAFGLLLLVGKFLGCTDYRFTPS